MRTKLALLVLCGLPLLAQTPPTSTTFVAPTAPLTAGLPVTLSAGVTPAATGGLVAFVDEYRILGSAPVVNGQATLTTAVFPYTGKRRVRASFLGTATAAPSVSSDRILTVTATLPTALGGAVEGLFGRLIDVNRDGKLDHVVNGPHTVVRLGLGGGQFGPPITSVVPPPASGAAVGDYNGDGKIDVLVHTSVQTYALSGNGDGSFGSTVAVQPAPEGSPRTERPWLESVEDLNRDGVADFTTDYSIFYGSTSGTFVPRVTVSPVSNSIKRITSLLPDLNGDGVADAQSAVFTYLGSRLGTPASISQCGLQLSTPAGYTEVPGCPGGQPPYMVGNDMNGDGRTDLVSDGGIYLNNGNNTFTFARVSPGAPAGDLNGDGFEDLVSLSPLQGLVVAFGDVDLNYSQTQTISVAPASSSFLGGEFLEATGDGVLDYFTHGTLYIGGNTAPPWISSWQPVDLTLAAGAVQTFTFDVTDPDGAADVASLDVSVWGCRFRIDTTTGKVFVDGFPRDEGWIFNATCGMDTSSVTLSSSGNTRRVSANFTLQEPGTYKLEASARDRLGLMTTIPALSSLTVTKTNVAPSVGSVTSGSGTSAVFTMVLTDPNGASDVLFSDLLINDSVAISRACFISVKWDFATVSIVNNAGNAAGSQPIAPGSPQLANSQCTVDPQAVTRVFNSPTQLTVTIPIQFSAGWTGTKKVYVRAIDRSAASTGFLERGAWTLRTPQGGQLPSVVGIEPRTGSGPTALLTAQFHHPNGAAGHYLGYILVLPTPNVVQFTAQGSCLMEYNRISNGIRLIDNAGTGWLGGASGVPIGVGAGVLENDQCSVNVSQVTAKVEGQTMTVTAPVQLKNAMGTVLGTFLQSNDVNDNWTGMTQFGNWVLPTGNPQTIGPFVSALTPPAAQGQQVNLHLSYGHKSGQTKADVDLVHVRIAESIVAQQYCHILYSPGANALNLINDAGTGLVSNTWVGWNAPNSLESVSNSRCTVSRQGLAPAYTSGPQMQVNFTVGFNLSTFSGVKNVYANVFDFSGRTTHWVQVGTRNVQ